MWLTFTAGRSRSSDLRQLFSAHKRALRNKPATPPRSRPRAFIARSPACAPRQSILDHSLSDLAASAPMERTQVSVVVVVAAKVSSGIINDGTQSESASVNSLSPSALSSSSSCSSLLCKTHLRARIALAYVRSAPFRLLWRARRRQSRRRSRSIGSFGRLQARSLALPLYPLRELSGYSPRLSLARPDSDCSTDAAAAAAADNSVERFLRRRDTRGLELHASSHCCGHAGPDSATL